ncbi:hypothetical protein CFC21_008144 [Triticum aestivum]|uniref:Uncharacterized protein n=2 Tax=Triticum aestivum TaxID=4565 RepID=A0A9R1ISE1_WHEAT|nr:hypothetical protein CFC21_008144 [Triticum aestivum]
MKRSPVVSQAWQGASASSSEANPNPAVAKVVLSLDPLSAAEPSLQLKMEMPQTKETSTCNIRRSCSLNMLSLLLHLLAIATLPCSANNATQLVYDTEGNELNSKSNYYILPAKPASGGGLKAVPTGLRCLHFVVEERSKALFGTPLRFTPLPEHASASEPIRLSSDIWIEFHDLRSFCSERLDWHLTEQVPELSSGEPKHVAAGSEEGLRSFWGVPG